MKTETVNILKSLLERDNIHPILSVAEHKAIECLIETIDISCWVETSERFPESSGEYLVTFKDYYIPDHSDDPQVFYNRDLFSFLADSDVEKRYSEMNWKQADVVAWTKIPDTYIKEGGNEDGVSKGNTDSDASAWTNDAVDQPGT